MVRVIIISVLFIDKLIKESNSSFSLVLLCLIEGPDFQQWLPWSETTNTVNRYIRSFFWPSKHHHRFTHIQIRVL
ncbi:hypothetical protein HanOQP8_Chr09g0308111 [Helianthus annuus]|nr:hypothetical protein HanOQP8_Chr09g0308111 [Helianthus annuus]